MLTPQEVSEHAFAKASFGGYNMAMVDEFLDLLTADYTALYNENAVLKSKMKVLVDKVEEYRSTEEAMRTALMTAPRMADDLVQEAERKKTTILQDAEHEAADKIAAIRREVTNEEFRLTAAQNATTAYVVKLKKLHQEELDYLDRLSQLCPPPAQPQEQPPEDPVAQTAQEIEDNVQRLLAAETPEPEQPQEEPDLGDTAEFPAVTDREERPAREEDREEEDEEEDEDERPRVRRIDFGNLQFGRDYEIK